MTMTSSGRPAALPRASAASSSGAVSWVKASARVPPSSPVAATNTAPFSKSRRFIPTSSLCSVKRPSAPAGLSLRRLYPQHQEAVADLGDEAHAAVHHVGLAALDVRAAAGRDRPPRPG